MLGLCILIGATLSIISCATLYVNTKEMSKHDTTGLNLIDSTKDRNKTDGNLTNPITQKSTAFQEGDNIGSIASVPNKCLGSALCPD